MVILQVTDCLDGQLIYIYRYLTWNGQCLFVEGRYTNCVDIIRQNPELYSCTLQPRRPFDPRLLLPIFPTELEPLSMDPDYYL